MKLHNLIPAFACAVLLAPVLRSDTPPNLSTAGSDCDMNGLLDELEIDTDAARDANFNGLLDRCEGLSVDTLTVSVSAGGTQTLRARLGAAFGGTVFWVLGTTAGTSPGMKIGGIDVPLNFDGVGGYMNKTRKHPNTGELFNTLGFLDQKGIADASFTLPPASDPSLVGTELHHAYLLLTSPTQQPFWSSNAVSLRLTP